MLSFSCFRYSSKGKELVTQMSAMFCLSLVTISLALVLSLALAEHTVGSSIFVVSKITKTKCAVIFSDGSRIPGGGAKPIIRQRFPENCMKMKRLGRERVKFVKFVPTDLSFAALYSLCTNTLRKSFQRLYSGTFDVSRKGSCA